MPPPKAEAAYHNIRALLQRALESEFGLRLSFPTKLQALRFRQNAYTLRHRDRKFTERIYEEGHPMHGSSEFDDLTITAPEEHGDLWVLEINKLSQQLQTVLVEELDEPDGSK